MATWTEWSAQPVQRMWFAMGQSDKTAKSADERNACQHAQFWFRKHIGWQCAQQLHAGCTTARSFCCQQTAVCAGRVLTLPSMKCRPLLKNRQPASAGLHLQHDTNINSFKCAVLCSATPFHKQPYDTTLPRTQLCHRFNYQANLTHTSTHTA